ncbi:MAG: DsbA family protein [Pseudomonadota bacterium]|nr:DsbA family protein [Pseudomonadota bacterium]
MARLDIYWSFRSPYSWLATGRLLDISRDYAVETHFRPVRPLAMREPDFFERARPQFLPYLMKDAFREGQRLGVVILPPRPDPIAMDMTSGKVDAAQPKMDRLMGLAIAAVDAGKGLQFAFAAARRIWGGVENWHEGAVLAEAAEEAGLDLAALESWARDNAGEVARIIAESEAEQMRHHWGVPLMVLDDEPFFGQDRLDSLAWRLDQRNLKRR